VGQMPEETYPTFIKIGCTSGGTAETSGSIAGGCSGIDPVFDHPLVGVLWHDLVCKTGDGRSPVAARHNTPAWQKGNTGE
jgi:hypothetical protein